ncbi:hypothetical protein DFR58_12618 [Anaerobacterium chartisolvens]|uniref:Spo0E like sporulation regulatory protein n=1 Tax=Anaerobacterium chartisolvens TaxID=1297424 RepID=A0A369AQ53_9FIRM|nr:hypothetical protein [Anaerobacterium chartisolvens]RCX11245.1 hypothetical protein DFR58_12618 [Anaerobacterium chartisolvens]
MKDEMRELKTQIAEKNKILNSTRDDSGDASVIVWDAEKELDNLLYKYYKLIKYKGGGSLVCRNAF